MKLTTTLSRIKQHHPSKWLLQRISSYYPDIGEHDEIDLLEIMKNEQFHSSDIVWILRATVQDSSAISDGFVRRCEERHGRSLAAALVAYDVLGNSQSAAIGDCPDFERYKRIQEEFEKQRQDLLELLQY